VDLSALSRLTVYVVLSDPVLAEERLSDPREDLMSELMRAVTRDESSRPDAVMLGTDLLEGGVDVPANLPGNSLLALSQYPEQRRQLPERTRGRHVLHRYENGLERCIGCYLCAGACPADCIYIEADENTPDDRVSAGERYARVYEIDMLRCIFCGFCEEACPTGAITLEPILDISDYTRAPLIYTKDMLLEAPRDLESLPA